MNISTVRNVRNFARWTVFKGLVLCLLFILVLSSISSGAIFYPAPAFELKEVAENGKVISLEGVLKEKDTKGVILYFMTTW